MCLKIWDHAVRISILNFKFIASLMFICAAVVVFVNPVNSQSNIPFAGFAGRWVGEGQLGYSNGENEKIKCRLTYFISQKGHSLEQNIRCGTSGAKIEINSKIDHQDGELSGTWLERTYNIGGNVTGRITNQGIKIFVKSDNFEGVMQISQRNNRQTVEIQLQDSEIMGLTLDLRRG